MSATVTIGGYEPVAVSLWGENYQTVPATRSVGEKSTPLIKKLQDADSNEDMVAIIGSIIDLRVRPIEGTKKASTLIKEQWKKDRVTVDQLVELMDDVREADRPT